MPPLGLLTVASMLPREWEIKLVDMNVTSLRDDEILWCDYVFLSGMNVQLNSMKEVIKRCNNLCVKVVAGGPMCTTDYKEFAGVDHFILNEAEVTLPMFLKDLQNGGPNHIYTSDLFPDITESPVPRWDLLEFSHYANMNLQYSRGCPFDCEFCGITTLNGHIPRTKGIVQFMNELESLYRMGWYGPVFVVDDNFIGNKGKLKREILPAIIEWQKKNDYPFQFCCEVSINLADDEVLARLMVKAGFNAAFVGIETPNIDSLEECGKNQNLNRDLVTSVKKLHSYGIAVHGGFIVGFDSDSQSVFQQQINFIQKSGIVMAMVGILNAISGTRLFKRLKSERRLLKIFSGDNMDASINFEPKMNPKVLQEGYRRIIKTIYSQKMYYERVKNFLRDYSLEAFFHSRTGIDEFKAFIKSLWILGVLEKGKKYFWKLLFSCLIKHPKKFAVAVRMAIFGYHFRRVAETV